MVADAILGRAIVALEATTLRVGSSSPGRVCSTIWPACLPGYGSRYFPARTLAKDRFKCRGPDPFYQSVERLRLSTRPLLLDALF